MKLCDTSRREFTQVHTDPRTGSLIKVMRVYARLDVSYLEPVVVGDPYFGL